MIKERLKHLFYIFDLKLWFLSFISGNLGKALVLFFSIVAILHNVHNLAIDSDEYNKAHQMNNDFYGTIDETNPRRDDIEVENLSEENDDFGLDSDFESDIDSDLDNIGINKEDSEQLYDARRNKGKLKRGKEITFRLTKNLKKKGTPLEILKWIAKIVNKLSWKKYYKKVYPGKIRGPKSCNDRIAVVGAGPSGVHMAYLLKKKGFKNIKIYEETSRIGKCFWYIVLTRVAIYTNRSFQSLFFLKFKGNV